MAISVIIPANNEEDYIGVCLESLLDQTTTRVLQVIVAANGCNDSTVEVAKGFKQKFLERNWGLVVLDIVEGGKHVALNRADEAAIHDARVYLDADIVLEPMLVDELAELLSDEEAVYASGTMRIAPAKNWITRAYGRFWSKLPFFAEGVQGAGLFAVNGAGRKRWQEFPGIISDDGYVRLLFKETERKKAPSEYRWPLVEGFRALSRVRKRQDQGMRQISALFPALASNADERRPSGMEVLRYATQEPLGFAIYLLVKIYALPWPYSQSTWERGR